MLGATPVFVFTLRDIVEVAIGLLFVAVATVVYVAGQVAKIRRKYAAPRRTGARWWK